MIVSYEGVCGGLLLREVETEEEAFAEIRRFLEVNKILSVYTEVRWVDPSESYWSKTRHKRITMGTRSDGCKSFGIYYTGYPDHLELGSEESCGIKREYLPINNHSYYYKSSENKYVCWYDEVVEYFKDLAKRKAGEE